MSVTSFVDAIKI